MKTEFIFDAKERDDGSLYITGRDLPGFRLLIHPGENAEAEIMSAFKTFYPLYIASKAKSEMETRAPKVEKRVNMPKEFSLLTEFALA